MLEAATQCQDFTEGLRLEDFWEDAKTRAAVIRCLEVIGEAASKVSMMFAAGTPKSIGGPSSPCVTDSYMVTMMWTINWRGKLYKQMYQPFERIFPRYCN